MAFKDDRVSQAEIDFADSINPERIFGTRHFADNKTGLILCINLLKNDLRKPERDFVCSIAVQITVHPIKFRLSDKQYYWFCDLWHRYIEP